MNASLTPAQTRLLTRAVEAYPQSIDVEVEAKKTLGVLIRLGLIEAAEGGHVATPAAFDTLGILALAPSALSDDRPVHRVMGVKTSMMLDLLSRPHGVTIVEMSEATGWLPHSVRGFMAGALKKKHGHGVTSEVREGARFYHLAPLADA